MGNKNNQLSSTMGRSGEKSKSSKKIIKKIKKLTKYIDIKKFIIKNVPFVIMGIIMYQFAPMLNFVPFPRYATAILADAILKIMVLVKGKNAKKWRKDMEYGSARWGKGGDIKPLGLNKIRII